LRAGGGGAAGRTPGQGRRRAPTARPIRRPPPGARVALLMHGGCFGSARRARGRPQRQSPSPLAAAARGRRRACPLHTPAPARRPLPAGGGPAPATLAPPGLAGCRARRSRRAPAAPPPFLLFLATSPPPPPPPTTRSNPRAPSARTRRTCRGRAWWQGGTRSRPSALRRVGRKAKSSSRSSRRRASCRPTRRRGLSRWGGEGGVGWGPAARAPARPDAAPPSSLSSSVSRHLLPRARHPLRRHRGAAAGGAVGRGGVGGARPLRGAWSALCPVSRLRLFPSFHAPSFTIAVPPSRPPRAMTKRVQSFCRTDGRGSPPAHHSG